MLICNFGQTAYVTRIKFVIVIVNKIFHQLSVNFGKFGHYVIINKTLSAPPKRDYMCVNSTQRKYREKLHRENTTAN